MSTEIARECPRFNYCSVNNCPLDPHMWRTDDQDPVCTMNKPLRLRIAARHPGKLSREGMTIREYAFFEAYSRIPKAVKDERNKRLKDRLAKWKATNPTLLTKDLK